MTLLDYFKKQNKKNTSSTFGGPFFVYEEKKKRKKKICFLHICADNIIVQGEVHEKLFKQ